MWKTTCEVCLFNMLLMSGYLGARCQRFIMAFPLEQLSLQHQRIRPWRIAYQDTTRRRLATIFDQTPTEAILPSHVQKWLDIQLPEGRCVGVCLAELDEDDREGRGFATPEALATQPDHWMHTAYHPKELAFGMELSHAAATSFWLGRLAMRIALQFPDYPILKDSYGRPELALGGKQIYGSISHKGACGIALVSNSTTLLTGVGVDLELTSRPGKRSIASRVLTEWEQDSLGSIPGVSVEEEILLRFSLKEAIYKAAHPILCRYVGFQQAEVTPHADGTASCTWYLESDADKALGNLKAHWRRLDDHDYFLTSAMVQPAPAW